MAKGSSQSQASSTVSRAGSSGRSTVGAPTRRTNAAAADMRRRRTGGPTGGGGFSGNSNMLRFYTDDAPGLKITPTFVLVMSLCFIGFVSSLHVMGTLSRFKIGGV